ncbi:MAG: S-adenosylmethionine:tRNA ribosyltransferase-isomerase [Bacteroidales bacterium]|nr:S-adenosylmethionine:tRNA ribosyltransferase-isomerase [Bacteroidales bacterium]
MILPPILSHLDIEDYDYQLTDERIAKFPLDKRDESKLLLFNGHMPHEDKFKNLFHHLPEDCLLVLNNTRVVHARLLFRKETGALIEVFCLEPAPPSSEIQMAFQQKGEVIWKCLLGNARRWKSGELKGTFGHEGANIRINVEKVKQVGDSYELKFTWQPAELTFAEILEGAGKIPLPPYLNRSATESDNDQYQTVYAQYDGSVAAPTAGLHFTPELFTALKQRKISIDFVTLHVGAGTFKPIGRDGLSSHTMHSEQVIITKPLIEKLIKKKGNIVAVGTTSVRTLESLYWYGVKLEKDKNAGFLIDQFDPYQSENQTGLRVEKALQNTLDYLKKTGSNHLTGYTQLMIAPGYQYRMIRGMITNFHQPRSTLLLLIAAWLGDKWKEIYDFALENDFRFLSYGDACLFLK